MLYSCSNRLKTLSFCMVAGIIATIGVFSQEATAPATEEATVFTGSFETTLIGVKWGRQIGKDKWVGTDVTVTQCDTVKKTITVIVKADGKEMEIPFADVAWNNLAAIANALIKVKPGVPFDRVVTWTPNGPTREIKITIVERIPGYKGVNVRFPDGKKMKFPFYSLATEDVVAILKALPLPEDRVNGKTLEEHAALVAPTAKPTPKKSMSDYAKAVNEAAKSWDKDLERDFHGLSDWSHITTAEKYKVMQDLHNLIIAGDPKIANLIKIYKAKEANPLPLYLHNGGADPEHTIYSAWYDANRLKALEFKPLDEAETVTLRPQLDKFGIKSLHQGENDCEIYAGYSLACYLFQKDGKPKPTLAAFKHACYKSGRHGMKAVVRAIVTLSGKKPTVSYIPIELGRDYQHVWIKHYLRNGIPLLMCDASGNHRVLLTGFKVDPEKKYGHTFEYLDSYGTDKGDGGYRTQDIASGYAIWFE